MIDTGVIEKAKTYDKAALAALTEYYYPKINKYLFYKVSDNEDAKDLTHEVFIKMVKNIGSLNGPFENWLFTIARNMLTDFYRKKGTKADTFIKATEEFKIDAQVQNKETEYTAEEIKEKLSELPEEQKDVVIKKFFLGMSNKEIAGILNRTEGAVKQLQFRAISKLKKLFSNEE
ncbi:RNA polymerase sigma factor [Candidatus Margulisiibacteriota bacterium]